MGSEIAILFDRLVPESLHPYLQSAVGQHVRVFGDSSLFRVCASGYFAGTQTADILNFARAQDLTGALIVADQDEDRVLYFQHGRVAGAQSTVLFERLGRVLLREGLMAKDAADELVDIEENNGLEHVLATIPDELSTYGLERRIWDVSTALYFARRSHFLIVEGECDMHPYPTFSIEPEQLAMEGMRCYDEWRNVPGEIVAATSDAPPLINSRRAAMKAKATHANAATSNGAPYKGKTPGTRTSNRSTA